MVTVKDRIRQLTKQANRAGRYVQSTVEWASAGVPERTDEDVNRIAAICVKCEHFNSGICNHKNCGCGVRTTTGEQTLVGIIFGGGMVNKIRRATEHCPIGKW